MPRERARVSAIRPQRFAGAGGPFALVALLVATALAGTAAPTVGQDREVLYERTFGLGPDGRLTGGVADMDLDVEGVSGGEARITVFARARDMNFAREVFEATRFEVTLSGGELRIDDDEHHHIDWRDRQDRGGAHFRAVIQIPVRTAIDLTTGDGDITLVGTRGDLELSTGDGDVFVEDVEGPGVRISTGDGDVNLSDITAERIRLTTGDGDLAVERASGEFFATTGDGDVRVELTRFNGVTIQTGDGDVTVLADPSLQAEVHLEGEDLAIAESFSVTGRLRNNQIMGSINGGGPRLTIRTGDGAISLRSR